MSQLSHAASAVPPFRRVTRACHAQGLIGIALANSPEFVAAAAGGKACFGTNPIAFGIPQSAGPPLTFDMATSAIALFGVLTSKAKGEPLPEGVAYKADGSGFTTDPSEALEGGAIATFGGHKGAGLSLCVELLAGDAATATGKAAEGPKP